jgi:hypothetical protein
MITRQTFFQETLKILYEIIKMKVIKKMIINKLKMLNNKLFKDALQKLDDKYDEIETLKKQIKIKFLKLEELEEEAELMETLLMHAMNKIDREEQK